MVCVCVCVKVKSFETIGVNNRTMDKFSFRPSAKFCGFGGKTKRMDKFRIEQIMKLFITNFYIS